MTDIIKITTLDGKTIEVSREVALVCYFKMIFLFKESTTGNRSLSRRCVELFNVHPKSLVISAH